MGENRVGGEHVSSGVMTTGAGSGSVAAADGSTIWWKTALDGSITATGSEGRVMVITPSSPQGAGISVGQLAFSAGDAGEYLKLTCSTEMLDGVVSVEVVGGGSQLTTTITASGSTTGTAAVSGNFGAHGVNWNMPIDLAKDPASAFASIPGFQSGAFDSLFEKAAYFGPVCAALVGPVHHPPVVRSPLGPRHLAGDASAAVTGPTSGIDGEVAAKGAHPATAASPGTAASLRTVAHATTAHPATTASPATTAPSTPKPRTILDEEGWGEFLGKAFIAGLGAVAVTVVTVGTGGLDLAVGAAVFTAGADVSMATDDIHLYATSTSGSSGDGAGSGSESSGGDDGTGGPHTDGGTVSGGMGDTGTPDGGTSTPDVGTGTPDGGTSTPDGGTSTPDGGGAGCFAAGTPVLIDGHRARAIEDVGPDDLVASRDEVSRADGSRRVVRLSTHQSKPTIDLQLESGEKIRTTSVHRVFTVEQGVVNVGSLRVGDHVETLSSGPQAIVAITPGESATVHNLTIADYHTYFVGMAGMWVHNDKD
jgi:Pretoxin HINT domain